MYRVLKVDGPNVVTDKGMVTLSVSQYADGGKTFPVDNETWREMRAVLLAGPALVSALLSMLNASDVVGDDHPALDGAAAAARSAIAALDRYRASGRAVDLS